MKPLSKRHISPMTLDLKTQHKGSASALLVILVVLLITFGILSITSAQSHHRIAERHAQWNRNFHALESSAEKALIHISDYLYTQKDEKTFLEKGLESQTISDHVFLVQSTFLEDTQLEVSFTVSEKESGRTFFVTALYDLEHLDHAPEKRAWYEKPQVFDYDFDLPFKNIEPKPSKGENND